MDSLYQARVKKNETDLLIDQLKETLHYLTVHNKVTSLLNFLPFLECTSTILQAATAMHASNACGKRCLYMSVQNSIAACGHICLPKHTLFLKRLLCMLQCIL